MLPSIRAGRSSGPCASFVRLAKHRAHRPQGIARVGAQCKLYATEAAGPTEGDATGSGSLSSKTLPTPMLISVLSILQDPQMHGTMR